MMFDGPFLNMETCDVGIHFYCQYPIYPLQSVTQHKVKWTSKQDPTFSQEDNLNILEFETLPGITSYIILMVIVLKMKVLDRRWTNEV